MNSQTHAGLGGCGQRKRSARGVLLVLMVLALVVLPPMPAMTSVASAAGPAGPTALLPSLAAAPAANGTLTLSVVVARDEPNHPGGPVFKGDPIDTYKYLINVDNTGNPLQPRYPDCSPYYEDPGNPGHPDPNNPNPDYPNFCDWPSIRAVPGAAPIYTHGNQDDFNGVIGNGVDLPPGKYIISVLNETYKLGGTHFQVPPEGGDVPVTVALQPHPLPVATMQVIVFNDISPTNGAYDAPAEEGLAGFKVLINDILGQLSTDVFGNPLCTIYDAGQNIIPPPPGYPGDWCLYSGPWDNPNNPNPDPIWDRDLGMIKVPNLGPNRYDVEVHPPAGSDWVETTTLEGSHSWDTWLQEGASGLDNEFVVAGEPFPWTWFGFVQPTDQLNDPNVTGVISGTILSAAVYLPQSGGLPYYGGQWNGLSGAKVTGPISDAWVALADLQNGDTAVYVGPADANGHFVIENVPDGNYFFSYWDFAQEYIMDWMQVTVIGGGVTDLATPFLTGWFTWIEGYVFEDANNNGFKDPGEQGVSDYVLVLRERDNSIVDRMTRVVTSGMDGYYRFDRAYPLGSWIVLEAYSDRHYTTGISYKTEVQPDWTTVLGAGVDVGVLPILGHTGRVDWGVRAYDPGTNGGIVGTVSYDVTRNELDPRYAVVEDWQPGIPGLTMQLWAPVPCGTNPGAPCDPGGYYELTSDGAYAKGTLLNEAQTETWEQPVDCQARDAQGNPTDQYALPPASGGYRCLEAPQTGLQFQTGFATVDGNYGFGDGCFEATGGFDPVTGLCADGSVPTPLPAGDYLVQVVIPTDDFGKPKYIQLKEEDINIFGGDQFVPEVPPPACAGPLHTVDVLNVGTDGYPPVDLGNGVIVPASMPIDNPSFADNGGSPYEGMAKPTCDVKLVTLNSGKSIAPLFNLFTEVPIPGKWKGYIINDLLISTNQQDLNFGEKAGLPLAPIGVYDFKNNLLTTITSDPNGVYETLMPSTWSVNCPSPSGVCPGTYFLLGNDPGQPGALNANYNPQFRTIGATFEIWPGVMLPSDLAPTQIVAGIIDPGTGLMQPADCSLAPDTPQLMAVSVPYVPHAGLGASRAITITGLGFGATPGQVTLDGSITLPTPAWSDTAITVRVPPTTPAGPHQLQITAANGQTSVNGLTVHVLDPAIYRPVLYWVNPPPGLQTNPARTFFSGDYPTGTFPGVIQAALNMVAANRPGNGALVVVFPGVQELWNPYGAYYENLVINARVKLQGVGPGGLIPNPDPSLPPTLVPGSVIDGAGVAGDTPYATAYRTFLDGLTWDGNQTIYEGAVVYVLAQDGEFTPGLNTSIDGFTIQGGDQQANAGGGGVATIQGGGIFANAYARYLQITNNILKSNGGAYGGAIRLGTPNLPGGANDNQNDSVRIAHNRIFANGGTNLAGGVGIFAGSEAYEVAYNDICGNYSAEYGGGISHFGMSPGGAIHHNRIYLNTSYDEGGGIMIAGELPADPFTLSEGAGAVDVYNNLIQANLGNDDGGGLRFLNAGNFVYNVYNNIVANNVSTHEGGGVSINDAPQVRVFNNTIMKNITTATALTSNGFPAPAGLSSARNSALLQATLPPDSPLYSDPLLFNNIFWDNRAGLWTGGGVAGIGLEGDPSPINYWDLGIQDGSGLLTPNYSIFQQDLGLYPVGAGSTGNQQVAPQVVQTYDLSISVLPWRGNPRFVSVLLVAVQVPPNQMGDYHIQGTSPAKDSGVASWAAKSAPVMDMDGQARPNGPAFDIGADELQLPPPPPPFPATPVLDNFDRANGALGDPWFGNTGVARFRVFQNGVQVRTAGGNVYWNPPDPFGADQEVYMDFTKIVPTAAQQSVFLKFSGADNPAAAGAALIQVVYDAANGNVQVRTHAASPQEWVVRANIPATFVVGDRLGARAQTNGIVTIYKGSTAIGFADLIHGPQPWPNVDSKGRIGVWYVGPGPNFFDVPNDARFDNFGGGTMP